MKTEKAWVVSTWGDGLPTPAPVDVEKRTKQNVWVVRCAAVGFRKKIQHDEVYDTQEEAVQAARRDCRELIVDHETQLATLRAHLAGKL